MRLRMRGEGAGITFFDVITPAFDVVAIWLAL
jgi:hypothetical protein